jgi:cytochrome c-type biogenesis protein CcmH
MVDRYGQFVLLRPSFGPGNAVLWLTPLALLGAAGIVVFLSRRRSVELEPPLTEEEAARLAELSAAEGLNTIRPNIRRGKTGALTET